MSPLCAAIYLAADRPVGLAPVGRLGYRQPRPVRRATPGTRSCVMPNPTDRIHSTAVVAPEAELSADVRVGAFALIEGRVRVGSGTIIHPRAHLIGPLTLGQDNEVYGNAILGGRPQHFHFK